MSAWRQQGLIEAPLREVWELLLDPARSPEWNSDVIEVTGAPVRIEKGATFTLTGRGPLGIKGTSIFEVEKLDDLHEVRFQCQTSGFYSHWFLTEAQGNTFAELELGVDPQPGLQGKARSLYHSKRWLRGAVENTLDALDRTVSRPTDDASQSQTKIDA
jgi:uncharacterized protein YndB with AHSA1/START domain